MINRSSSFLKRFKTEKPEKTWRECLPNFKNSNKTPTNRYTQSRHSPCNNLKQKSHEKIQLKQRDCYVINCVNHPQRRALFEQTQQPCGGYCQDCCIKLVKHNIRMVQISEESLQIQRIFEEEMEKMSMKENQLVYRIKAYFEQQRQMAKKIFAGAKQSSEKIVRLARFKQQKKNEQQLLIRLKQIAGRLQQKKVQFLPVSNKLQNICMKQNEYEKEEKSYRQIKQISVRLTQYMFNKQNFDDRNQAIQEKLMAMRNSRGSQNLDNFVCMK